MDELGTTMTDPKPLIQIKLSLATIKVSFVHIESVRQLRLLHFVSFCCYCVKARGLWWSESCFCHSFFTVHSSSFCRMKLN